MKRIVTFGEIMLRLTPPGYTRLTQASSFEAVYGGGEANVAVSLACFGLDVEFVTKLPENDVAQAAVNHLRGFGVGTDNIIRGGERMGTYYLERGASQRPSKVVYDRAHSAIAEAQPSDFDWDEIFEGAGWFHLTGITPAISKNAESICMDAMKKAKEKGLTVSFDPNFRAKLWSAKEAAASFQRILPFVDVLISNESQAQNLFGAEIPQSERRGDDVTDQGYLALAAQLAERFSLKAVALTERRTFSAEDNSFCAKLYDGNKLYTSEKYRIDIVDRVGGGDAFAAGLIYAMLMGYSGEQTVGFAAAASCLKHTIPGDCNTVTVDEVLALCGGKAKGNVQR